MMYARITYKIKRVYHKSYRHKARMLYFLPLSVKNAEGNFENTSCYGSKNYFGI